MREIARKLVPNFELLWKMRENKSARKFLIFAQTKCWLGGHAWRPYVPHGVVPIWSRNAGTYHNEINVNEYNFLVKHVYIGVFYCGYMKLICKEILFEYH